MAFALYFPIVYMPCLLERVLTYFNVCTKLEVLVLRKMMLFFFGDTNIDFSIVAVVIFGFCFRVDIFTNKISNLLLTLEAEGGRVCESGYPFFSLLLL